MVISACGRWGIAGWLDAQLPVGLPGKAQRRALGAFHAPTSNDGNTLRLTKMRKTWVCRWEYLDYTSDMVGTMTSGFLPCLSTPGDLVST